MIRPSNHITIIKAATDPWAVLCRSLEHRTFNIRLNSPKKLICLTSNVRVVIIADMVSYILYIYIYKYPVEYILKIKRKVYLTIIVFQQIFDHELEKPRVRKTKQSFW